MRVEAIERLGFGYEAVAALKPDIVYCAATGFDQDGPDAGKPAFDDIIQAASGLVAIAGIGTRRAGLSCRRWSPTRPPAWRVVNAVLAALFHRERTGKGPICRSADAGDDGRVRARRAYRRPRVRAAAGAGRLCAHSRRRPQAGARPRTAISACCLTRPTTGRRCSDAVGRPELAEVPLIEDREQRHTAQQRKSMSCWRPSRARAPRRNGWRSAHELDIPATPVYGLDELPEHPQLDAVGLFQTAGTSERRHGALHAARDQVRRLAGLAFADWRRRSASTMPKSCARPGSREHEIAALIARANIAACRRTSGHGFRTRRRAPHAQGPGAALRRATS